MLISIVNAGFFDWFKSSNWITGAGTETQATTPNLTLGNVAPAIENITIVDADGSVTLTEAVPTNIEISFLAMDMDGNDNLDNSSAYLNVTLEGYVNMRENNSIGTNPSCTAEAFDQGGSLNTTALWYNCTVTMEHWDIGGSWNCTAQVSDSSTNVSLEVDNCFRVQDTLALNMTASNITWPPTLAIGAVDQLMATEELNITNTGNQNISNVTLRAMDLIGEKNAELSVEDIIGAENFTATWGERYCDYGQYLTNATNLQILFNGTGTTVNKLQSGAPTDEVTNNATHICLESFSDIIAQQAYSTIGHGRDEDKYWRITGGTGTIGPV